MQLLDNGQQTPVLFDWTKGASSSEHCKFLIGYQRNFWFFIVHKKFKFPIGHWIEILLLIGIKVGKQISFLPLAAFLCLTFLLTLKLDDISFKITTIEYVYSINW
jgi:hypothetical protein